jgi:hypothetical protein
VAAQVRAFGKLPTSREFLQIDTANGAARSYEEWLKSGHDQWVVDTQSGNRGRVAPSRLLLRFPNTSEMVIARLWASADAAGRTFPFSLFVLAEPTRHTLTEVFALASVVWTWLDSLHQPFEDGSRDLRDLRREAIAVTEDGVSRQLGTLEQAMTEISLLDWLRTIAKDSAIDSSTLAQGLITTSETQLLNSQSITVPLVRRHDPAAQAAAWLSWLGGRSESARSLNGVLWRQDLPDVPPAMSILGRAPLNRDFQLLTTDATECTHLDDLGSLGKARRTTPDMLGLLDDPHKSLLDFASYSLPA